MTGYASKSILLQHNGYSTEIIITIKSLNSRFFEIFFKLPFILQPYEVELHKYLKERLVRGSIQCIVSNNNAEFFQETILPSINTARAYYDALQAIKLSLHIDDSVDLDHLVQMPNLFTIRDRVLSKEQRDIVFSAFNEVADEVLKTRNREGDVLKRDIVERLSVIENEMRNIKKLFIIKITDYKARVHETLQEIKADESVLASAQRTALYTMLDKLDLQEEITRFENHAKNMITTIESHVIEKGKRLDFTLQEMMREGNTILAKCNDVEISNHAITIKVELEKIREQIQNIL